MAKKRAKRASENVRKTGRKTPRPGAPKTAPAFAWTAPKEEAARLLAEDELSDEEIAAKVGISDRQLRRWKEVTEFSDRIRKLALTLGDACLKRSISRRSRRVKALDDRWHAMQSVIEARKADPDMQKAPGGSTGLMVRTFKGLGSGDNFRVVEEFEVDVGLLRELREHEKQAAQEIGEWVEKQEHSGPDGKPIQTESKVTHDVAAELAPYADAFRQLAESVVDGIRLGALPPNGSLQQVDQAKAPDAAGRLPDPGSRP